MRLGGPFSDVEQEVFARLRAKAAEVRATYIGKPIGKRNVAALEYISAVLQEPISIEATSCARPYSRPLPRSQGGYFEPAIDPRIDPNKKRVMDTDAEYKLLSELARQLDEAASQRKEGVVYLFTELQPCKSCESVFAQFKERFPLISIVVAFDYPYPP